jgi:outer membrane protein TolC
MTTSNAQSADTSSVSNRTAEVSSNADNTTTRSDGVSTNSEESFVGATLGITNSNPVVTNVPAWLTQPLSLADALNLTLQQDAAVLQAKNDLEASYGIVIQTRAIAVPKIQATGSYEGISKNSIDSPNIPGITFGTEQTWTTQIRVTQSIYEGGRMLSAFRTARLTKEQAMLQYQTVLADTLLLTRVSYYDVLLAAQQITVNEASVALLTAELQDQQRRFDAGTVPRFNVLRAEVAVANARPALIHARNDYRISKNNLSNLLGYNLPTNVWEDIPLHLTDSLDAAPYRIDLPVAIQDALQLRTELGALRKAEELSQENVVTAKAGYKPSIQIFGGYGDRSSQFTNELTFTRYGWLAGAQMSWDIFDGMLTRGKIVQAKALNQKAKTQVDDKARQVELEVRTSYSTFVEAREVLESQLKVQEEAEESLRLAKARADAGTGTQLDVLDAETSLTQARTTNVQALRDYDVARARLDRAIGRDMTIANAQQN